MLKLVNGGQWIYIGMVNQWIAYKRNKTMFVAMIRNCETKEVNQVHLTAGDRQEAASMGNRTADHITVQTGIFHRVQDIIEVHE